MLSNKSICLAAVLCSLIYLSQAQPYGGYGGANYGFPSMYGSYGQMGIPGHATKPYNAGLGNNIGYGFPNPMGYQSGLSSYGFGNNLNKHKGYMGNSFGHGYNRPGFLALLG